MKILHICAYTWAIGGPAKMIFDHTRVHAAEGHQITILTPVSADDVIYDAAPGVQVVPVPRHWFSRFFPEFSIELWHYLKQHGNDFDLIHVHGLWHFGSVAPYLLKLRPPKLMTIHGLLDRWTIRHSYWKKQLMSTIGQRQWVRQTPIIHVNNEQEREDVRRYLGHPHPQVTIIPNGLRPSEFAQIPTRGQFKQEYGIKPEQRIILFLSRLNVKKGLDILLPAFKRLSQERADLHLVLAGPDDGYLQEIEQFIRQHKLEGRVLLPGMLIKEQKLAAFADADVFTLPTYSESFAIAALEALATGTPSLLTEHVGFGNYIRSYQSAHLCEPTEQSVYDGLTYLLDHPDYSKDLAKNAQRMIAQECDIDVLAKRLLKEYVKLTSN
ncbi:glycosyltransferase [Spirosoma soli]|uniref:Glycosyltransferase n=1 Tax=Spirosoma soli TaxID=1770529 RepID=A0ABW5LXQ6_9BACT